MNGTPPQQHDITLAIDFHRTERELSEASLLLSSLLQEIAKQTVIVDQLRQDASVSSAFNHRSRGNHSELTGDVEQSHSVMRNDAQEAARQREILRLQEQVHAQLSVSERIERDRELLFRNCEAQRKLHERQVLRLCNAREQLSKRLERLRCGCAYAQSRRRDVESVEEERERRFAQREHLLLGAFQTDGNVDDELRNEDNEEIEDDDVLVFLSNEVSRAESTLLTLQQESVSSAAELLSTEDTAHAHVRAVLSRQLDDKKRALQEEKLDLELVCEKHDIKVCNLRRQLDDVLSAVERCSQERKQETDLLLSTSSALSNGHSRTVNTFVDPECNMWQRRYLDQWEQLRSRLKSTRDATKGLRERRRELVLSVAQLPDTVKHRADEELAGQRSKEREKDKLYSELAVLANAQVALERRLQEQERQRESLQARQLLLESQIDELRANEGRIAELRDAFQSRVLELAA